MPADRFRVTVSSPPLVVFEDYTTLRDAVACADRLRDLTGDGAAVYRLTKNHRALPQPELISISLLPQ